MTFNRGLHRGQIWLKYGAVLVILMAIIGLSAGCISANPARKDSNTPEITTVETVKESPALYNEDVLTSLYERTTPAVVEINTVVKTEGRSRGINLPPLRGQGSGFLIDKDGHILTNYHVVGSAAEVKVILHDGRTLDAAVAGTDREDDLALLKVDSNKIKNIVPLPLGDSDAVKPGQMAIALGAPYGLEGSITVGVVSGIGRSLPGIARRPITDMIQTDAAINFGNSGGPLLNSKSEVIGVNTAIEASFSGANGIGYAVPINTAKSVIPSLIKGEEIHRPWLGIGGMAITPELAEKLELPTETGVYVIETMSNSPAEESGLKGSGTDQYGQPDPGGDIITAVDGQSVAKVDDLVKYFNSKNPGDEVTLSVSRGNEIIEIRVTLGEWPEEMASTEIERLPLPEEFRLPQEDEDVHRPWLGISGTAINSELAKRLDLPIETGVYVISVTPNSPAEKAGLRGSGTDDYRQPTFGGDIITAVDKEPVTKMEDLANYFKDKEPGDEVSLSVSRGDETIKLTVTLGEWPEDIPSIDIEDLPLPKEFRWDPFRYRWDRENQ